jgi:hypothetical protein
MIEEAPAPPLMALAPTPGVLWAASVIISAGCSTLDISLISFYICTIQSSGGKS